MTQSEFFHMRISPAEEHMLQALAQYFERSKSDTVRLLIREVARQKRIAAGSKSEGQLQRLAEVAG